MLKDNLKIAIRIIIKDKLHFFINILGLSIGIVFSLFLLIYIQDELSFDKHFKNYKNIYRVNQKFLSNETHFARCAPAFAPLFSENFPDIQDIVRLNKQTEVLSIQNQKYEEQNFFFADSNFFKVFDFEFIKGDPENALKEPNSIVLTEHIAEKYFGSKDPLNESIFILNSTGGQIYKVAGVIENSKRNTHFQVDILASFSSQKQDFSRSWFQMANFYTYLTLPNNYDYKLIEDKIPDLLKTRINKDAPTWMAFNFQPLKDIHLKSKLQREIEKNGDIKLIFIFIFIAISILLIASINYINLSIAKSSKRANEIGLRKIVGANNGSIIKQYFSESVFFCFFVFVLSLVLLIVLFPLFKDLVNKDITLLTLDNIYILIELIGLILLIGLIAGLYPAFVLSSFKPLHFLKGNNLLNSNSKLRRVLIIFQFTISSILIACSIIIFNQINYMENTNIGFNKNNILAIKNVEIGDHFNYLKNEFLNLKDIFDVTAVMSPPSVKILDEGSLFVEGFPYSKEAGNEMVIKILPVQMNFIDFMKMELIAGRNFSEDFGTDSSAYIINESAMRKIGWKTANDAIGKRFQINGLRNGSLIGVVKDFNYSSLHEKIDPMVLFLQKEWLFTVLIKTKTDNTNELIPILRRTIDNIYPNKISEIITLDSLFDDLYSSEKKQLYIVEIFSILAIITSCMGLLGLLMFIIEQKKKEVGIRKVNGASSFRIVFLFLKDFTKLIIIGNLIAIVLVYHFMNKWLQNFAYHTIIEYWIFIVTFLITIIITYLIVSIFTIKAARANPIKVLKCE